MSDIVFLDAETLGLELDSPIWEFAAVRRSDPDVQSESLHLFIDHDPEVAAKHLETLPDEFADDYRTRSAENWRQAVPVDVAAHRVREFLDGRPHIVGAVPSFDTERIAHQWMRPHGFDIPWHYHLIDIENVIIGYLVGLGKGFVNYGEIDELDLSLVALPWKSDDLSRAVDVDPELFDRHTAMGDVRWVMAQWDAVMGGGQ